MSATTTSAVKLALLAAVAAALVVGVDGATRARIAAQRSAGAARALAAELGIPALAQVAWPSPRPDRVDACAHGIGAITIVRGRAEAYGGTIEFDVALDRSGRLLGVGIADQHETRGVADPVIARGSAFQRALVGRDPTQSSYALRADGGDIDAVTGATITSRALIAATSTSAKAASRSTLACPP